MTNPNYPVPTVKGQRCGNCGRTVEAYLNGLRVEHALWVESGERGVVLAVDLQKRGRERYELLFGRVELEARLEALETTPTPPGEKSGDGGSDVGVPTQCESCAVTEDQDGYWCGACVDEMAEMQAKASVTEYRGRLAEVIREEMGMATPPAHAALRWVLERVLPGGEL